jgi:hypothetical protein
LGKLCFVQHELGELANGIGIVAGQRSGPCWWRTVVDTRLDGNDRIVTFFSGAVQREPLVDLDDEARRLVYAAVDSPIGATHYNASVPVFADGEARSRIEWIVDVLPNELVGPVVADLDLDVCHGS